MLSGIFRRSARDLHGLVREYPPDASAYELLEDCGKGVSATVYRAYCKPLDEVVAVKKMNLETVQSNLDEIVHEAQLMKNYNHPNVLPLYTSFVEGSDLWMVMPFISGGSVLHIIKYAHPEGLEELVISTIMRDVLKALDYVHRQGGIHRDIKAGNILVDKDGSVKLADFGVATTMDRSGSWGHDKGTRMTFVGTPCWMAPEVMEQTAGYDNAADIWSFGIAMLEMAHGHAPFAKYPPMKVLLMTLQNPPPSLEDKGKKHFSKAMRDVVTRCLQKDPRSRPTAAQLLEHKFFKQAKDEEYLARYLMAGLPSLGDRVQEIRAGKAATHGIDNERNFARSQEEYKKGVSSWNFNVAALKAAADLENDEEPMLPTIREDDDNFTLSGPQAAGMAAAAAAGAAVAGAGAAAMAGAAAVAVAAAAVVAAATSNNAATTASTSSTSFATAFENGMVAAGEVPVTTPALVQEPPAERSLTTESWSMWQGSPEGNKEQGSNQSAAAGVTKQPARTKGRFSVYSESDSVPPMSPSSPPTQATMMDQVPVAAAVAAVAAATIAAMPAVPASPSAQMTSGPSSQPASGTSTPLLSPSGSIPPPQSVVHQAVMSLANDPDSTARLTMRRSEDGSKRDEKPPEPTLVTSASVAQLTSDGEAGAKRKGRFTVIENSSGVGGGSGGHPVNLDRKTSHQGLETQSSRLGSQQDFSLPTLGRGIGGAVPPVTAILPRLQELLDHAAQQQSALFKLLSAVQDTGSTAVLQSSKPLFDFPAGSSRGPRDADSETLQDLRSTVRNLQARLAGAEAENVRLRARNLALETGLSRPASVAASAGARRDVSESGGAPGLRSPSPAPLSSRASEDGLN